MEKQNAGLYKTGQTSNSESYSRYIENKDISSIVKIWLIVGLFMIFVQIIVGGITRLTGSGLSITKWEIITGTLPPMNDADWLLEFNGYRQTPQYKKINKGMSLSDFKFIYFWEYFHRLWARSMGLVFAIPFFIFWWKRMFSKDLMRRLIVVLVLASVVASFGWIMVASGLVNRPWVNAYKLTIHLSLGFLLFCYLLWTVFLTIYPKVIFINNTQLRKFSIWITIILSIQVLLGGLMSGMKAGLFYPTWPDMNGEIIPQVLTLSSEWNVDNFVNYDTNSFMPAFVQFLHRSIAYILIIMILWFGYKIRSSKAYPILRVTNYVLVTILIVQILLGIFTVINCKGTIPLGLGVLHQAGSLILLSVCLYTNYKFKKS